MQCDLFRQYSITPYWARNTSFFVSCDALWAIDFHILLFTVRHALLERVDLQKEERSYCEKEGRWTTHKPSGFLVAGNRQPTVQLPHKYVKKPLFCTVALHSPSDPSVKRTFFWSPWKDYLWKNSIFSASLLEENLLSKPYLCLVGILNDTTKLYSTYRSFSKN